jgi:short subunit dehydrogenase-like uncharacterized protein
LAECAILLVQGTVQTSGGSWTTATCFGLPLVERLKLAGVDISLSGTPND